MSVHHRALQVQVLEKLILEEPLRQLMRAIELDIAMRKKVKVHVFIIGVQTQLLTAAKSLCRGNCMCASKNGASNC